MPDVISILLADDHDLVREGMKALLRAHPEFNVVGEARNGRDAVREATRLKPQLVIMDIRMPILSGIEACREIRDAVPDTNVLMLTSYGDDRSVLAAVMAGAGGFLLKDVQKSELVSAIRTVGAGGKTLDAASAASVMEHIRKGSFQSEEERLAAQLNERELAVLDMIAEGLTNREIGERLYLSEKTVKHHVSDLLAKLGLTRRVEAAAFAARRASSRL